MFNNQQGWAPLARERLNQAQNNLKKGNNFIKQNNNSNPKFNKGKKNMKNNNTFATAFKLKFDNIPLSPREKLAHLKANLESQPLALIKSLDLTDENYDIALQKLDEQYDCPADVISNLYHKLTSLPRADKTSELFFSQTRAFSR